MSGGAPARAAAALVRALPSGDAWVEACTVADVGKILLGRDLAAEELARLSAMETDRLDHALFAARSIDTGDTGLTVFTGLRTAYALFRGGGTETLADQQRTDLALKLVGLAFVVSRLLPGEPENTLVTLQALPAGRRLLNYVAVAEVALPFRDAVLASKGGFAASVLATAGTTAAGRLLTVAGKAGMAEAENLLPSLVAAVDAAAIGAAPKIDQLASSLASVLPTAASPIAGLVAHAADALPCWRVLVARLAAESRVHAAATVQAPPNPPVVVSVAEPTPPPPAPEPEPAPEAEPAPKAEPAPAPSARMGGVWLDPKDQRLVFTDDGGFTHSAFPGKRGAYHRKGDFVTLDWPDVRTTRHKLGRTATRLHLDDVVYRRADWDLSGRAITGTFVAPDGSTLRFDAEHRWAGAQGAGTYRLGPAKLTRVHSDGATTEQTLWTDGLPHASRPDVLFLDNQAWPRARS